MMKGFFSHTDQFAVMCVCMCVCAVRGSWNSPSDLGSNKEEAESTEGPRGTEARRKVMERKIKMQQKSPRLANQSEQKDMWAIKALFWSLLEYFISYIPSCFLNFIARVPFASLQKCDY